MTFHRVMKFYAKRAYSQDLSFYRLRCLGIEMHKRIKGPTLTFLNESFIVQATDYQLCDLNLLIEPKCNIFKFGFKSFRHFDIKLWNIFLIDFKQLKSLSVFETEITERNGVTALWLRPWERKS